MNIFRLLGDLSHLLAIIILLLKIWKTRSCADDDESEEITEATRPATEYRDDVDNNKTSIDEDNRLEHMETVNLETSVEIPNNTPNAIESKVNNEKDSDETNRDEQTIENDDDVLIKNERPQKYKDFMKFYFQFRGYDKVNNEDKSLIEDETEDCVDVLKKKSHHGISGKSQILFSIVYTSRYLDLLTTYISAYNTFMKVVFIGASYATVYLMYVKFKATYDHNHDTFRIEFLLVPCVILALVINHSFTFMEIMWTFSIYLEAVAILPQLFLVSKTGEAESITSHYLFALGSYRALYLLNWMYRYYVEDYYEVIAIVAGLVQTVLYCDFFYLYITKVLKGKKLQLPA